MTAVEFYNSKVIELMKKREQGTIDVLTFRNELDQVFEQAKAMEKQENIEFACQVAESSAMKYIQGKTTRMIAEELLTA